MTGKILGVDTSIWLNKAIFSCPEFCHHFHQVPHVSVEAIIEAYLNSMHSLFISNNIKLLFVLDGARNPLKAMTNESRKKKSDAAEREMTNLIITGDPDNMRAINQLKKKAVYVREDVVAGFINWCDKKSLKYVCAFMEAEWELSRLEADGIIDGVVSEDSDCLVLGCETVVQLLNSCC
jgi:exonuclease 1